MCYIELPIVFCSVSPVQVSSQKNNPYLMSELLLLFSVVLFEMISCIHFMNNTGLGVLCFYYIKAGYLQCFLLINV